MSLYFLFILSNLFALFLIFIISILLVLYFIVFTIYPTNTDINKPSPIINIFFIIHTPLNCFNIIYLFNYLFMKIILAYFTIFL